MELKNKLKIVLYLVFANLFYPYISSAQVSEIKDLAIYKVDYLEVKNAGWVYENYNIPSVKIYKSEDLSGKPYMELSKVGLKINDKLVCEWFGQDVNPQGITLKQLKIKEPCKEKIFPIAINPKLKADSINFWIIANGKKTNSYYSAIENNTKYFIDKKTVTDFILKESPLRITSKKYENNYSALRKFLNKNQDLKVFLTKMIGCIDKKDPACMNIATDVWTKRMNLWAKYFCTTHSQGHNSEFKSYCGDLFKYLCDSNQAGDRAFCSSNAKSNSKVQLTFSNLSQKEQAEALLWTEMKSCFSLEPKLTRLKINESENLFAENDENYFAACTLSKNSASNSWELESITLRQDDYEWDPVQLFLNAH